MKIYGISLVRNEIDVIRACVLHNVSLGLDRVLVIDNGSTDGTRAELDRLAQRVPLRWLRDEGLYLQPELMTSLAREALAEGADWVVPFDADEFWYLPQLSLRSLLEATEASVLAARVVNFVQRRGQLISSPESLSTMVYRALAPVAEERMDLVEAGRIGYLELAYPVKIVTRNSPDLLFAKGQHSVSGVPGEVQSTPELVCLHAPLRSRAGLDQKADNGRRAAEVGFAGNESWHLRRWRRMQETDGLDEEWAANSYRDGALDVHGETHPWSSTRRCETL